MRRAPRSGSSRRRAPSGDPRRKCVAVQVATALAPSLLCARSNPAPGAPLTTPPDDLRQRESIGRSLLEPCSAVPNRPLAFAQPNRRTAAARVTVRAAKQQPDQRGAWASGCRYSDKGSTRPRARMRTARVIPIRRHGAGAPDRRDRRVAKPVARRWSRRRINEIVHDMRGFRTQRGDVGLALEMLVAKGSRGLVADTHFSARAGRRVRLSPRIVAGTLSVSMGSAG